MTGYVAGSGPSLHPPAADSAESEDDSVSACDPLDEAVDDVRSRRAWEATLGALACALGFGAAAAVFVVGLSIRG